MTLITHNPVFVSAGTDRYDQPCHMGDQSTIDIKVSTDDTAGHLFVLENRQTRGFGPPRHVHPSQEEWFLSIEGEFRIEVGEKSFVLRPGDSLLAPRGIPHVWVQTSSDAGRLLVGFQPAGKMESFFREIAKLGRMPPPAEASALFAAHDMTVLGPPLSL